ncbi:hypothetical protein [Limosilactobacillus reuteri]|uniref:Uncharacterized protein n=1 Tax=Limosilactobacillus reuteri TaxID=1598 RepID=A0A256SPY5_LIMRT|nr:hypothetical protein [Limosilactobacillus reuteri]MRG61929.1 hypothetical protein [Limosilactobacillus reuteri]MRI06894.1 hypothetical protein [Limosilactobacillus reuteri]OYS68800.1 hypothetical protein CBF96_06490 [Limosilactobacillus reuteri]
MIIINYFISLNENEESILQKMLLDKQFWPNSNSPKSINQLAAWAVDDYIDYYKSFTEKK